MVLFLRETGARLISVREVERLSFAKRERSRNLTLLKKDTCFSSVQ